MEWDYLDKIDKNLLYSYAKGLAKNGGKIRFQTKSNISKPENDIQKGILADEKRDSAFYLLWFAYRYILNCQTFEEAKAYANVETLKELNLYSLFKQRYLFIGTYGFNEIYLYRYEDIPIALEILYYRYNLFEQLECYINQTTGTARTTHKKCIKSIEFYKEILDKHQKGTLL